MIRQFLSFLGITLQTDFVGSFDNISLEPINRNSVSNSVSVNGVGWGPEYTIPRIGWDLGYKIRGVGKELGQL